MTPARPVRLTWAHVAGASLAVIVTAAVVRGIVVEWRSLDATVLADFHLDLAPLAAAWLLQTLGWLVVVDTWRRLLEGLGARLPFVRHLQVYSYSALAYAVPGSIWVPIGRVALYLRSGIPAVATGAAVVVEWMLLGVAGLVLYGLSAPFSRAVPPRWAPAVALAGLLSLVLLHPAVFGRVVAASSRLMRTRTVPTSIDSRHLVVWFLRELAVLSLSGVSLYLFMLGIAPGASLPDAMAAAAWMMAVSNLFALLPSTAVVKDGGMVLMLGPMFGSTVVALAVAVFWRIWLAATGLSWAGLAALAGKGIGAEQSISDDGV